MMKYETIIVSDVHLGNKMSRAKELTEFLKTINFERLILLGDIFQDLNFSRLNSSHWKFLSYIRKISKEKEVIWVRGNHDVDVDLVMSNMLGIPVQDEYVWKEVDGKYICAMHGHQFDGIAKRWKWSSKLGGSLMIGIQRIFGDGEFAKKMYKKIDTMERTLTKAPSKIKKGAIKYGIRNGYDVVICGHTHHAEHSQNFGEPEYVNTGHWLSHHCSYVTIDYKGEVVLNFYDIPILNEDNRDINDSFSDDTFIVE